MGHDDRFRLDHPDMRRQVAAALDRRLEQLLQKRREARRAVSTRNPSLPLRRSPPDRAGFTLIEILVVVLVILALAGIAWPVATRVMRDSEAEALRQMVQAVASGIANHGRRVVDLEDGSVRRLWDFNSDGILDGRPADDPGFASADRSAAAAVGYRGFLVESGLSVKARYLEDATGRLRDPWGRPIRIDFDAVRYGSAGVGLASDGPDGQPATDDDITSWSH